MTAISNSLPPGFRFHPTDGELIHYLKNKIFSSLTLLSASIIAEIDLYKLNPWDLPDEAYFGDSEWFGFSPRDRKYPKGARAERTAASGYWKATGTDQPILSSQEAEHLGVKKPLIFYKGRAPKGTKTNWMMHEYRLPSNNHLSVKLNGSTRLDDWVLCRIRHKGVITELKQESGSNSSENACTSDLEYEESIAKTEDQSLQNYRFLCQNNDDEGIAEGSISDENFECEEIKNRSLKEALESIKRVLSLGALDDQVAEWPSKKSCSLNPSDCGDNSTIFEISFI